MTWLESILIPDPPTLASALIAMLGWLVILALWTKLVIRATEWIWPRYD